MKKVLGFLLMVASISCLAYLGCGRAVKTDAPNTTSRGISGTITDYYGGADHLEILIRRTTTYEPEKRETISIAGTQTNYSITVEAVGSYYVYAVDNDDVFRNPAVGNWVGGYGWEDTNPLKAAGNASVVNLALTYLRLSSIEVSSSMVTNANFTMHQIISAEVGYTITGTIYRGDIPADRSGEIIIFFSNISYGDPSSGSVASTAVILGTSSNEVDYSLNVLLPAAGKYWIQASYPFPGIPTYQGVMGETAFSPAGGGRPFDVASIEAHNYFNKNFSMYRMPE